MDMGADDPFAVKHVVWFYNCVPNYKSGLTPLELLTKQKADHRDILRSHVWNVLRMCSNLSSKMARSFPSEIVGPDLASS